MKLSAFGFSEWGWLRTHTVQLPSMVTENMVMPVTEKHRKGMHECRAPAAFILRSTRPRETMNLTALRPTSWEGTMTGQHPRSPNLADAQRQCREGPTEARECSTQGTAWGEPWGSRDSEEMGTFKAMLNPELGPEKKQQSLHRLYSLIIRHNQEIVIV